MYFKPRTKQGRIEWRQSQIDNLIQDNGAKVETYNDLIFVTYETQKTGSFRRDGLLVTKKFQAYNLQTWRGTKSEPDNRYYYRKLEQRNEAIEDSKNNSDSWTEYDNKKKREAKEFITSLKIRDILVSSWGYDQTNIDFYQVTKIVSSKMIEITPIGQNWHEAKGSFMSEYVTAKKDAFTGNSMRKRVTKGDYINLTSYSGCHKWDGQKMLQSHYA